MMDKRETSPCQKKKKKKVFFPIKIKFGQFFAKYTELQRGHLVSGSSLSGISMILKILSGLKVNQFDTN
jgi:hypothetical protein